MKKSNPKIKTAAIANSKNFEKMRALSVGLRLTAPPEGRGGTATVVTERAHCWQF
jgi:hypothetical protein